MPGPSSAGTPPPEVPAEFAEAYRAAYLAALEAQSVLAEVEETPRSRPRRHAAAPEDGADVGLDDLWDLPERTRPIRIGTHREPEEERESTAFGRLRDSGWLAPVMLLLIAVLLVVGAYVVGRLFSNHVADPKPDAQSGVTAQVTPAASRAAT